MCNSININDLKQEDYMNLTENLNIILLEYWTFLNQNSNINSLKNISFIYEIINTLNLQAEIKNITINDATSYIGGYYNNQRKELSLSLERLLQLKKLELVSNQNFIIEYLTILFHELFHAIQYKYMNSSKDYLISTMKKISNNIKKNYILNSKLHSLIPDEREASLESAKLIYDFYMNNNLFIHDNQYDDEIVKNLNFYLTNGYFYRNKVSIFPYKSISKLDENVPELIYDNLSIFNKMIYGLDIGANPTVSLFTDEATKKVLKL